MLTSIILTHNSSLLIKDCISTLKFSDNIIVVDDNSTDDTVEIAKRLGVTVHTHALNDDFAAQRNWAMDLSQTDWVLFVDPDEKVSPELAKEITSTISSSRSSSISLHRIDFFLGKQLRFGDTGNFFITRLVRKGSGKWTGKVHEVWNTSSTPAKLKSPLFHYPHPDIVSFLRSINFYSSLRAKELHEQGRKTNVWEIMFFPIVKFVYLWFIKLGLLDGTPGTIHAIMMSFHTFLVRSKLFLLCKGISGHPLSQ